MGERSRPTLLMSDMQANLRISRIQPLRLLNKNSQVSPLKPPLTTPHLYACGTCTRLISCTVWWLSACPSTLVELSTSVTRTLRLPSSTWITRPGGLRV